jgi:hypothetical protein
VLLIPPVSETPIANESKRSMRPPRPNENGSGGNLSTDSRKGSCDFLVRSGIDRDGWVRSGADSKSIIDRDER